MPKETVLEQIIRLRGVLTRAAHGMSEPEDAPILQPGNNGQTLDVRLVALMVAGIQNLADTIHNRQNQIALAMSFARLATFYARQVSPDLSLWTDEINDDIEEQKFLFLTAQQDLEELIARAEKHPQALPLARRQKQLMDEFDRRNERRTQGLTLYEIDEKPEGINEPETELKAVRAQQFEKSLEEINLLINRAVFTAKTLYVLETSELEDLQKAGVQDENQRCEIISRTLEKGLRHLEDAETMLRYHAARHSAFPRRLDGAKPHP